MMRIFRLCKAKGAQLFLKYIIDLDALIKTVNSNYQTILFCQGPNGKVKNPYFS